MPTDAQAVDLTVLVGVVDRRLVAADLPGIGDEGRRLFRIVREKVVDLLDMDVKRHAAEAPRPLRRRPDRGVEPDELMRFLVDERTAAVTGEDGAVRLDLQPRLGRGLRDRIRHVLALVGR